MFECSRRPVGQTGFLRLWLADVWMFGRLRRSTPTVFVLACVASRPGLTSHQPGRLDGVTIFYGCVDYVVVLPTGQGTFRLHAFEYSVAFF